MSIEIKIIIGLVVILVILIFLYRRKISQYLQLELQHQDLAFKKQSQSTKYGKMTEQFLPFLEKYPYNEQAFRFIGSPIDGIQFTDDAIILVEFKSAAARLTPAQKKIKKIVEDKKVYFEEYRIGDKDE
jgi:predicted Holliday junction resolvase-like endonuclease